MIIPLRNQLITFNYTIGDVSCVNSIFDMLRRINATIIRLPSEVNQIFDIQDQIANLTKYQDQVTTGISAIDGLNSSLSSLPDFENIIGQIDQMNSSLAKLPDLSGSYKSVVDLYNTMSTLPDMSKYSDQVTQVGNSLSVPNLDSMFSTLNETSSNLDSVPDLSGSLNSTNTVYNVTNGAQSLVTAVYNFYFAQNASGVFTAADAATMAAINSLFDGLRSSRTNFTSLINSLNSIKATFNNTPDISSIRVTISNLNSSVETFPDINTLYSSAVSFNTSLQTLPDFDSLVNSINKMDSSIASLPNLNSTREQVQDVKKNKDDADLGGTIDNINAFTKNSFDSSSLLSKFDTFIDYRKTLDDYLPKLSEYEDKFSEYYYKYFGASFSTVRFYQDGFNGLIWEGGVKSTVDLESLSNIGAYLMIFMHVLMALPFFFSLCGLCAICCRKGCPSMCMSFSFCVMMIFYFIFVALFMAPGVMLSDLCDGSTDYVFKCTIYFILFVRWLHHCRLVLINLLR